MQMIIEETVVPVIWESNASVAALRETVARAPIVVRASKYGGFEQVGALGRSLPTDDLHTTTKPGDIMLYSGNQLVVFFGSNSWSYTPLGRVDLPSKELAALLNKARVEITLAPSEG